MFRFLDGNREVNRTHLKNLIESIEQNNMLAANPIVINENREVIDGQHRLKAAEALGVPIYYTVVKPSSLSEVHLLNTTNRSWFLKDFLDSYATLGYPEYLIVKDYINKYKTPISLTLAILSSRIGKSSPTNRLFKKGQFVVTNQDEALAFGQLLLKVRSIVNNDQITLNGEFALALWRVYSKLDQRRFITQLESSQYKMQSSRLVGDFLRQIEAIYNYGHSKNAVRLF